MSLSRRAEDGLSNCYTSESLNALYANDPYDETSNPTGFIKLSSADNILSRDLITQKFSPEVYSTFDPSELNFYPRPGGEPSTREAVATFINTFCTPGLRAPINKDQLVLVPGVTYTSDLLSQSIFDEGDSLITFAPLYYRFPNDFGDRGLIHVESIDGYNHGTNTVELCVEKFEEKFQQLEAEGKPVKAILLVSPRNPDGGVFSLDEMRPVVEWAVKKHSLYVIFDEIYNLTVFDPLPNGQTFQSGIKIFDDDSSLDPNKLVWTWGLSKIFSIPGLRVAAIYSPNERLLKSVNKSLMYQGLNFITQHFVREILKDHDWIKYFFQINQQLLKTARDYCLTALAALSTPNKTVRFLPSQSAFFILVDFSDFLGEEKSWEEEKQLHQKFKDEKVLIVTGQALFMSTPGWFRIVFSAGPKDELIEGINRIGKALKRN